MKTQQGVTLWAAAKRIVLEFDEYGETLQLGLDDEGGVYGPTSAIEQLRAAVAMADPVQADPPPDGRLWVCPDCHYEDKWRYEELAGRGSPVCPQCDTDMELVAE